MSTTLECVLVIFIVVLIITMVGIIFIAKECYESTNSVEYKNKKAE